MQGTEGGYEGDSPSVLIGRGGHRAEDAHDRGGVLGCWFDGVAVDEQLAGEEVVQGHGPVWHEKDLVS